jgi:hypothetical protein
MVSDTASSPNELTWEERQLEIFDLAGSSSRGLLRLDSDEKGTMQLPYNYGMRVLARSAMNASARAFSARHIRDSYINVYRRGFRNAQSPESIFPR